MTADETDALLRVVCPKTGTAQFKTAYNFLLNGLTSGVRELGWPIEVPTPIHALRPPASRFPLGDYESLGVLRDIQIRFLATITDPRCYASVDNTYLHRRRLRQPERPPLLDVRAMHMGHILLSAILHGALLKERLLVALVECLQGLGPEISGEVLWLSLQIPVPQRKREARTEAPQERVFRRYFPDPVTGLLVLRFLRTYGPQAKAPLPSLQKMLTLALQSIDLPIRPLPTFPALLRLATLDHRLKLAPGLVEYAAREFETRSLPPHAWARLRHGLRLQRTVSFARPSDPQRVGRRPFDTVYGGHDQAQCISAVRKAIKDLRKAKTKSRARRPTLAQIRSSQTLCPILYYLVLWVEQLAARERPRRRKLAVSTIATYFSRIGPRLVAHGLDFSVEKADIEDFDVLYSTVLASAGTDANRRLILEQLENFHGFLRERYDLPEIEVDLQGGRLKAVDTNLVTQLEYQVAIGLLADRPQVSEDLRQMQHVALMLGFRAGMRRSEIAHLRLRDIQILRLPDGPRSGEIREVEIVLRAHSRRTLKSDAARRRLPLQVLLTDQELQHFTQFVEQRSGRASWPKANHEALLFSAPGEPQVALSSVDLFDPITMALQAASGDPSLRFRHLRHSFANRLLMFLWSARHSQLLTEKWLRLAPGTEFYAFVRSMTVWWSLIGLDADKPSRKALFALGITMGHAEPTATLQSYVHVADLILGASLEHHAPELDVASQAVLLDLPAPSWRVTRSRNSIVDKSLVPVYEWATRRAASLYPEQIAAGMTKSRPAPLPAPSKPRMWQSWPTMLEVYRAVALLATTVMDRKSLYERAKALEPETGYDARTVLNWHRASVRLASMKTARGRPIHARLHRGSAVSVDRRSSVPGVIPGPPHLQALMEEAERIFDKIMETQTAPNFEPLMRAGMKLVLRHGNAFKPNLHLPQQKDIRLFIDFVTALDIADERISISVPETPRSEKKSTSQHWGHFLGISPERISGGGIRSTPNQVSDSDVEGMPHGPRGASVIATLPKRAPDGRTVSVMRSLRFACFIATVLYDSR